LTFKELKTIIESQPGQGLGQLQLQRLRGKAFWYWDRTVHKGRDKVTKGQCCMQHIIGLPKKDGKEMPLYDYERLLYRALLLPGYLNSNPKFRYPVHDNDPPNIMYPFMEKHLWIKKATGIGVTTFMLRFMAWLCLYNDDYRDSQMVIVVGPNQDLAIKLIKRMKAMFADKLGVTFDSKETTLELNGCNIEAYPSNHIDAFRSLVNPKFVLVDEGDFLPVPTGRCKTCSRALYCKVRPLHSLSKYTKCSKRTIPEDRTGAI
jgi:hypothetical protein